MTVTLGKVSIIIPLYNHSAFVSTTIDSALGQKYKDFEVIVVNDGSTDDSLAVAKSYGNRIVLLDQENQGPARARNNGVAASCGEFLFPLDSDDWIEPECLAKLVPKMEDKTVAIVSPDIQYFGLLHTRIPTRGLTLEIEMESNQICGNSLIRREAFIQTGGYNPRAGYEDWNLWIDILKRGWKVATVPEPLFHYRIKSVSRSTQNGSKHAELCRQIRQLHPDLYEKPRNP